MITERLEINRITPNDKEDYFRNISNDKKVLETFVCTYAESLEKFDFDPYLKMENLFAIRIKETGKFVGFFKNRSAMTSNLDTGGNYNEN